MFGKCIFINIENHHFRVIRTCRKIISIQIQTKLLKQERNKKEKEKQKETVRVHSIEENYSKFSQIVKKNYLISLIGLPW